MAKKKISTILGKPPRSSEKSFGKLLDSLAQRIFLPDDLSFETLLNYYIPRTEPMDRRFGYSSNMRFSNIELILKVNGHLEELPRKIGSYEKLLWNKLVHPPRNVLFIVGGIGCGKTWTCQLITKITKTIPEHCPDFSLCNRKRLHITMDFNEIDYRHESDFTVAYQKFVEDLSDRMASNLYTTLKPTDEFEFFDFWNHEINRQHEEGAIAYAFSKIVNEMRDKADPNWEKEPCDDAMDLRKEIFKKIKNNPMLFLDYQCRFWHYVLEKVYGGRRQCVFAILDNIDCASPALQAAVREVVISHQKRFGNTFVVCLRPETLKAKPLGVAANVIDVEPHCGPEPFDVLADRLKRFVENPNPFFKHKELGKDLEKHAHELACEIHKFLTGRRSWIIKEFVESLAGSNIRSALIMATNLLKLRIEEHDFGPYELNRAFISLPYEYYSRTIHSSVENIFHIEGVFKGLLVKGRILQFLRSGEQNTRTISEFVTMLGSFGYEQQLICKACNEMMEPAHQLIISNRKVEYSLLDFLNSDNDNLMLTSAGIGYADKLMHSLDYISMVMPDCIVESSSFPIQSGYGLLHRFRAVIAFLNILRKTDRKETSGLRMLYGRNLYIENFGETMLTWEIIRNVCVSISYILNSLETRPLSEYLKRPELRDQMLEVYRDIENILNAAARDNKDILGETVGEDLVLKPVSEELREEIGIKL